ncbi:hypothetical protein HY967_01895 [Candidatus Jorgensenbacteria bacterium]|nr:hypothetical protein [Candidatus Jorgensenbacteria bacterium]
MKQNPEVFVETVASDGSSVKIWAGSVFFVFGLDEKGQPKELSRGSLSQYFDRSALRTPPKLYADAIKQAAGILRDRRKTIKVKSLQLSFVFS